MLCPGGFKISRNRHGILLRKTAGCLDIPDKYFSQSESHEAEAPLLLLLPVKSLYILISAFRNCESVKPQWVVMLTKHLTLVTKLSII